MKKLSSNDILLFTKSMSSLLNSGVTLQNAIDICGQISMNHKQVELNRFILTNLNNGKSLEDCLSDFKDSFGEFYISLIRIGEITGTVKDVFIKLTSYLDEKKKMKTKMIQSISYPVIVLLTAIMLIVLMMIFVFPRLEDIFSAFNENGENVRAKIEGIKSYFVSLSVVISFLIIGFVVIKFVCKISLRAKLQHDRLCLYLPVVGKYWRNVYTADFCFAMRLLISSGIPLTYAITKAEGVVENLWFRSEIKNICTLIETGENISLAFSKKLIFPKHFVVWVSLCERTGNIEDAFTQLDEYYRNEMSSIAASIAVGAEPVFMILTGSIILMIATQFIMPVFKLLGDL